MALLLPFLIAVMTCSGVVDGLRKGRSIFVRKPDESEDNANDLLISKGAVPVDFWGNIIHGSTNTSDVQDDSTTKPVTTVEQSSLFG
jgi:hypothetical protein